MCVSVCVCVCVCVCVWVCLCVRVCGRVWACIAYLAVGEVGGGSGGSESSRMRGVCPLFGAFWLAVGVGGLVPIRVTVHLLQEGRIAIGNHRLHPILQPALWNGLQHSRGVSAIHEETAPREEIGESVLEGGERYLLRPHALFTLIPQLWCIPLLAAHDRWRPLPHAVDLRPTVAVDDWQAHRIGRSCFSWMLIHPYYSGRSCRFPPWSSRRGGLLWLRHPCQVKLILHQCWYSCRNDEN